MSSRVFALSGVLFASLTALGSSAPLDPRISTVLGELEKTRIIRQVALSPDAQTIAWVVDGETGTEIEIAPAADSCRVRRLTARTGGSGPEDSLAWSPDSKALAFSSNCNAPAAANDQSDIYLAAPAAASPFVR